MVENYVVDSQRKKGPLILRMLCQKNDFGLFFLPLDFIDITFQRKLDPFVDDDDQFVIPKIGKIAGVIEVFGAVDDADEIFTDLFFNLFGELLVESYCQYPHLVPFIPNLSCRCPFYRLFCMDPGFS